MRRHGRDNFYVVGEGILSEGAKQQPACHRPSTEAELRKFRFSRIGPKGKPLDESLRQKLATIMLEPDTQADSTIPAGFTYLGQFVDHDLTLDATAVRLGQEVTVRQLVQGRSPALDLDSLYGLGPEYDPQFYSDGVRLKIGRTIGVQGRGTQSDRDGFDLPRVGVGADSAARRIALIPDVRNDENLAVAQTHLAFIRFHNRVVNELGSLRASAPEAFRLAREMVVKHYQWMLWRDFLPRIVDQAILDDVFADGRRIFEVVREPRDEYQGRSYMSVQPGDTPTMPLEFSVAAYRLGHSMVRESYEWNRVFTNASLGLLFKFSGTSGDLTPPNNPPFDRLPTNWIADFRRLYAFAEVDPARTDLVAPTRTVNLAKRIDTVLVDPLGALPEGAVGNRGQAPFDLNLAFRNLTRAQMVELATGQQMASLLSSEGVKVAPLTEAQILGTGSTSGVVFPNDAPKQERDAFLRDTPLWFYVLREAELNDGKLKGVGGRIVAEVFHRAIEGSEISIVRDRAWRPSFGPNAQTFRMTDLLLFAFENRADLLNPLGD